MRPLIVLLCVIMMTSCELNKNQKEEDTFFYSIKDNGLKKEVSTFLKSVMPQKEPALLCITQDFCTWDSATYTLSYLYNVSAMIEKPNYLFFKQKNRVVVMYILGSNIFLPDFDYVRNMLEPLFPEDYVVFDKTGCFPVQENKKGEEWTLFFKSEILVQKNIKMNPTIKY